MQNVAVVCLVVIVVGASIAAAHLFVTKVRVDAPTQASFETPNLLCYEDFDMIVKQTNLILFTSETCRSCEEVIAKALVVQSENVEVRIVSFQNEPHLHQRYKIDGVPLALIANADGVVHKQFLGKVTAADLWAEIAMSSRDVS